MATCTPYLECTNKNESWESLFKRLIVEQEDGSLAIRTCCADSVTPPVELPLILTWDDIANVPVADASSLSDWNTFFFGAIPDPLLYTTMFTSVTVNGNDVELYGGSGITLTNGEGGNSCPPNEQPQLFEFNDHIIDVDDQCGCIITIANSCFYGGRTGFPPTYLSKLVSIYLPNCENIGGCAFGCNILLESIYIPLCTSLGTTTGYDGVFDDITGLTITVTCDASLLTCNVGAPDGDLCYLASQNTITVNGAPLTGCP